MNLLSAEISGNFAPFSCFPFHDRVAVSMRFQPLFGARDNLIELLCLWCALQLCFTLLLFDPQNGVVTVRINGFLRVSLFPQQGQRMHDSQELSYVIGAMYGP